jgi:hypothetical protein
MVDFIMDSNFLKMNRKAGRRWEMTYARMMMLSVIALGLSACAGLNRSDRSGYSQEEVSYSAAATDLYRQKQLSIENEAREELGLLGRPLTDDERQSLDERIRLKRAENKLATKREKKQYYGVRSALKNDRERLAFLALPNYEARDRWAQTRGLGVGGTGHTEEVARLIEANDIALGMSQKAVLESWGDPDNVEVAGNAMFGYERWRYSRYVTGNEGYEKETRNVFFEGGRVVGWERN